MYRVFRELLEHIESFAHHTAPVKTAHQLGLSLPLHFHHLVVSERKECFD